MRDDWSNAIADAISEATSTRFAVQSSRPCGGGCINDSHLLKGENDRYFVKLNDASSQAMFAAEARGLEAIVATGAIRAPRPITHGLAGQRAFLVLEAIRFDRPPADWSQMGRQLATMHRQTSDQFGWPENNFIGSAPQSNSWSQSWPEFFRDQRLRPQFDWAARNGNPIPGANKLLDHVEGLLAEHAPAPSLLHGDLWSGNAAYDNEGRPVVFDPACYYGDREADLAFTEMFGGFPNSFYHAYNEAWTIPVGYKRRKRLYNLYHIVNHANLFGGGYYTQAESIVARLLA
ncbi:MAG: fructosamine kinase family protein [Puniceicoccales bacterium]